MVTHKKKLGQKIMPTSRDTWGRRFWVTLLFVSVWNRENTKQKREMKKLLLEHVPLKNRLHVRSKFTTAYAASPSCDLHASLFSNQCCSKKEYSERCDMNTCQIVYMYNTSQYWLRRWKLTSRPCSGFLGVSANQYVKKKLESRSNQGQIVITSRQPDHLDPATYIHLH